MIDLRLGDAFLELPRLEDGSVDHVIADPPFDGRTHAAALEGPRRNGGRTAGGELPFLPIDDEQIAALALHFARVARRWILVFAADRQLETWARALELAGARVDRFGLARRTNPKPQLTGDRPAVAGDPIVIAHSARTARRWNGGGRPALWDAPPARYDEGGQVHVCQKPLALMAQLVRDFSDAGELVCDPFAGSGTTAVACRTLGRRLLGWELSADYHAAALRRIAGAREQLDLIAVSDRIAVDRQNGQPPRGLQSELAIFADRM